MPKKISRIAVATQGKACRPYPILHIFPEAVKGRCPIPLSCLYVLDILLQFFSSLLFMEYLLQKAINCAP